MVVLEDDPPLVAVIMPGAAVAVWDQAGAPPPRSNQAEWVAAPMARTIDRLICLPPLPLLLLGIFFDIGGRGGDRESSLLSIGFGYKATMRK